MRVARVKEITAEEPDPTPQRPHGHQEATMPRVKGYFPARFTESLEGVLRSEQQPDEVTRHHMKGGSIHSRFMLTLSVAVCGLAGTSAASMANAASGTPVAPPVNSAPSPDPTPAPGQSDVDPAAAEALSRQKGITIAGARARLARERSLGAEGARIEKALAGRTGGTYLDSNGDLVVTALDSASAATVTRNGARAQLVDDSSARLAAITKQLDRQSSVRGAGGLQGWYVDVPTNTVVVTVTEGAADPATTAMTNLAASFGASVRIDYRPAAEAPQPTEWLVGGFEVVLPNGTPCSIGFNTIDAANRNVALTAGHCTIASGNMSRNGYWIGATRTASYPGDDFGTFWNSYPSYWQPSPSVYKYNGTYQRLAGRWDNPPVGATVCKSGRTTGYSCGSITGLNQTVTYTGGKVISGLVRHNACVEGGDSGGANISAGAYALGMTSGASTSAGKCLSKVGGANVSWYQPVGEALAKNGLRLVL